MFEREDIALRSGAHLRCGSSNDIWVELGDQRVTLPYPNEGVGGGEMVVSPDERLAALYLYSGQTEEGYELFALTPTLRHLGGLPYLVGEGVPLVWSPDSRLIVMLAGSIPRLRGTDEYAEELLRAGASGDIDIDIAELVVQDVVAGTPPSRTRIHTTVPVALDPDVMFEWTFYEPVRFVADRRVALLMPSGQTVEVEVPPSGPIAAGRWL